MNIIDHLTYLFEFAGGLGMFLYGMKLLADGLQKSAGEQMKSLMNVVTRNKFTGILVGTLVTAIIQSSGATTVMVVGFVNAGIINLLQAVGVIMGADIGTTATAWIVSAGSLGDAFTLLKPTFYAPLMVGIGAVLLMFFKGRKKLNAGTILIGLGLLFVGLTWMSASMDPYMGSDAVKDTFTAFGSNPFLGILIGTVVTGIMQSSSASVGVLQTLACYGVVTSSTATYICLGAAIGSCFTALLSSIGTSRNARRAAVIHLMCDVIGAIVFGTILFFVFLFNRNLANTSVNSVQIAMFFTSYKILNTILLFRFSDKLVEISGHFVKEHKEVTEEDNIVKVDERIMNSPSIVIETVNSEVVKVGRIAYDNVTRALDALMYFKYDLIDEVYKVEEQIDDYVSQLSEFLVKVSNLGLTEHQSEVVKNLMYTTVDLERVGDHAENLAGLANRMRNDEVSFSESGIQELEEIRIAVLNSLGNSLDAREKSNVTYAAKTLEFEDKVDDLEQTFRDRHIDRLTKGECTNESGVFFLDTLTNLERISDHAVNVAEHVMEEAS